MPATVSTEAAKPRRARKKGDTAFWMRELKGIVEPGVFEREAEGFGFGNDEDARTAAHAKAKAFLSKQKDAPKEPKPDPTRAHLRPPCRRHWSS